MFGVCFKFDTKFCFEYDLDVFESLIQVRILPCLGSSALEGIYSIKLDWRVFVNNFIMYLLSSLIKL